jgi:gamma-glutamyltranspeptidase/glutathione hydrolase
MVATRYGVVASSHPLASMAGVQMLERGGSAVDAAIAANATLGVVEPMMNGIGGDLFAIIYDAGTDRLYGLNASGGAPAGMTSALLAERGIREMPASGILSVTVPGAVAGWDALHQRFGRLPFATKLGPAIEYAETGFPVTEVVSRLWKDAEAVVTTDGGARATYFPSGKAPRAGHLFRNRDLAGSLRLIAGHGRDGFYRGLLGAALVEFAASEGSPLSAADLASHESEWVTPIETTYRRWTVSELPPNTQGIAALEMLNVMECFPIRDYGFHSAKALHVMIEAKKLAYANMLHHVGDPRFAAVPVEAILSKAHAAERARLIDANQARNEGEPTVFESHAAGAGSDTIYLAAVDREGNMVSLIQSIYSSFGSGVVVPGTGFALQNRGALFTLEPDKPNTLAPRKRPLHTIIPGFMQKDGVKIAFGIMGGWNQAQAHAQFVSDIADFDLTPQEALEAGRFTKLTFGGRDVHLESTIPASARAELGALGHEVHVLDPRTSGTFGFGQAVMSDAAGVHFGASDPRHDGAAIPEPAALPQARE